jgi:hypothetical protein
MSHDFELQAVLEGISSDIELTNETAFNRIKVQFYLAAFSYEEIPIYFDCVRGSWQDITAVFQLQGSNYYNFENMSVVFQVLSGSVVEIVPVIFSVIRQPQSFSSYILQKLYCVTTTLSGTIILSDWNVKPNKTWYVDVVDGTVTLYETSEDMTNSANPIAIGSADSINQVYLTYVDEYEGDVELYYQDFLFHLSLSSTSGSGRIKVKPLTDMSEIRHPIYNNSNIVLSKGEAELNLHTNVVIKRELVLGTHIPELENGEVVNFTSNRRGSIGEKSQVLSQTISGSVSEDGAASLINTIQVANYMGLYR